jgi:hypothetical protein
MTLPSEPVSRAWRSTRSRISVTVVSMKFAGVQAGGDVRDAGDEVAQHVAAARRVDDLGVELDAVQVSVGCGEARERRRVGLGGRVEALGKPGDRVAVAHPDRLLALQAAEQAVVGGEGHVRWAVFAMRRRLDVAAQLVGHQLQAVADAEHRHLARPQGGIGLRRVRVVDR